MVALKHAFNDNLSFEEVAEAFREFYRSQEQEFPQECREADYEKRIKAVLSPIRILK